MSITHKKKWLIEMLRLRFPVEERWLRRRFSENDAENWNARIKRTVNCPDNAFLPRVSNAGRIQGKFQIMHNGLQVLCGGYYGAGITKLLRKNKGVHEPQEERVFQEVLKFLPPGSTMVELGAYWAFYSMWFCKAVPGARAFLVEPESENLAFGEQNFRANALTGHFTRALVGATSQRSDSGTPRICVDDFLAEHKLSRITILHSDIQGYELEMLRGAAHSISARKIDYFFLSTHSEELHAQCESRLNETDVKTPISIPPSQSYSLDGVLVGFRPGVQPVPKLNISRRGLS